MIEGKQIILRKMEYSDTDDIVRWRNQEDVRKRFIYQEDFTRETHLDWVRTMVDTGRVVQMMICERNGQAGEESAGIGRAIGSAFIRDIDRVCKRAEYGLFIGESPARGRGIGEEVTRLMLHYAFEELGMHRIHSKVLADNMISLKSAERAGLRREGYCREDVLLNGKYQDVVLLGVLDTDLRNASC